MSTFLVAFDSEAEQKEYYLSRKMEPLFNEMLRKLADGDHDAARNLCAALFLEFRREFEYGRLAALLSYSHNRILILEPGERGPFSLLVVKQLTTGKVIVLLDMTTVGELPVLPENPFSFTRR